LVLGAAGYIGSVTTQRLLEEGYEVIALDNFSKGHRQAVPQGAVLVEGDLGDRELIEKTCRAHGVEAALHFAAFIEVGESTEDPAKYFENNSVKTKALLDGLLAVGVNRFVFSSTAAVYGEPQALPIEEDHPTLPTSPYGWSKLIVERMLDAYASAYGLRSTALRYFNASGATVDRGEDHHPETHLIPILLEVASGKRESVSIYGDDWDTPDGTCIRDFVHIADLAEAHLQALKRLGEGPGFEVFNLGNGEGHSVKQVIESARQVTGHPIPAKVAGRRAGDPARLVASSEKAKSTLGWNPRFGKLSDIVGSAWEWRRKNPDGYGDR
jgi:UDP-glucose 4-epimerase